MARDEVSEESGEQSCTGFLHRRLAEIFVEVDESVEKKEVEAAADDVLSQEVRNPRSLA